MAEEQKKAPQMSRPGDEPRHAEKEDHKGAKEESKGAQEDKDRSLGRRTGGTTDEAQDEYEKLGINPRLDNRTGDQRPVLDPVLKPQQVDGPEVGHFAEHEEKHGEENRRLTRHSEKEGTVLGHQSKGPHGRGEEE